MSEQPQSGASAKPALDLSTLVLKTGARFSICDRVRVVNGTCSGWQGVVVNRRHDPSETVYALQFAGGAEPAGWFTEDEIAFLEAA